MTLLHPSDIPVDGRPCETCRGTGQLPEFVGNVAIVPPQDCPDCCGGTVRVIEIETPRYSDLAGTYAATTDWPISNDPIGDIKRACEEIHKLPPIQPLPIFAKIVDWLPRKLEDGTIQHWTIQFETLCLSRRVHEELMKLPEAKTELYPWLESLRWMP